MIFSIFGILVALAAIFEPGYVIYLIVLGITSYVIYTKWKHSYWSRHKIYSPPANILTGHFHHFFNLGGIREIIIDRFYRDRREKGEKLIGFYSQWTPSLMVCDIELAQKVMIKDFDHFVDRRDVNFSSDSDEWFKHMLTLVKGAEWKSLRSILTPTFTSGKMRIMFNLVNEKANSLVTYCKKKSEQGENVDAMELLGKYAMDSIGTCAFGLDIDSINGNNKEFVAAAMKTSKPTLIGAFKFLFTIMAPRVAKAFNMRLSTDAHDLLRNVIETTIKDRMGGERRNDFIDILLDARKSTDGDSDENKQNESNKISDIRIYAQAILFLLAGFDTTSNSLSFVIKTLTRYSEYQEKIRDELKGRMAKDNRDQLNYDDVMECRILDAFISETLRMYPVAPLLERKCTKDYKIPGIDFTIEKDTMVSIPTYSFHHDPDIFPEPFEFKPERFFPENKRDIPTAAYLPFGIGPRMCIAMRFAQMEMKLAVCQLLLDHKIVAADGYQDIKISSLLGITRMVDKTAMIRLEKLSV